MATWYIPEPTGPFPPVDIEVHRARGALIRAMLTLHRGDAEQATFYLWGREYVLVVENEQMTVKKLPRGTR